MLAKVVNKDTQTIVSALIKQAKMLPNELYKSLTWDRGKELEGRMFVFGGEAPAGTFNQAEAYDARRNGWSTRVTERAERDVV
jgi:hypothetical protein